MHPRGYDELDHWWEVRTVHDGHASSNVPAPEQTKAENAAEKKQLREREARRRPPGFAPWPETPTEGDNQ